jgi:hypothetical protein
MNRCRGIFNCIPKFREATQEALAVGLAIKEDDDVDGIAVHGPIEVFSDLP